MSVLYIWRFFEKSPTTQYRTQVSEKCLPNYVLFLLPIVFYTDDALKFTKTKQFLPFNTLLMHYFKILILSLLMCLINIWKIYIFYWKTSLFTLRVVTILLLCLTSHWLPRGMLWLRDFRQSLSLYHIYIQKLFLSVCTVCLRFWNY